MTWRQKLASWFGARPQDPEAVRERLVQEQRRLAEVLTRAQKAYEQKLAQLAARIHGMDEKTLKAELERLQAEQASLERAVARLEIAELETKELMEEWAEWQTAGRGSESAKAEQRKAMLRSELEIRGVRLQPRTSQKFILEDEEPAEEEAVAEQSTTVEPEPTDELGEWDELFSGAAEREFAHWNGQMAELLEDQDIEAAQALEVVKRYKEVAGKLRLKDREDGTNRDRLKIFY